MTLWDILQKNAPLKNIHAGKRCFIVGNAPSINQQDLSLLKDEINIVVTSFFRHPKAKTVRPKYWVIADPYFWKQPEQYFLPAFEHATQSAVSTKLFIPTGGINYFGSFNPGPLIDLHFYHFEHDKSIDSLIDFTSGIPPYANNVIMICIMLAYYMGCNPIYLIGCDHDFLKTTRSEYEQSVVNHFYQESNPATPSAFLTWEQWQVAMRELHEQYQKLRDYAQCWGFDVFNATRGGYLEFFPRTAFESLFTHVRTAPARQVPIPDLYDITETAIELMKAGKEKAAIILLDEALKNNFNNTAKVQGVYYLKAACLTKIGHLDEALMYARQDYAANVANRENSAQLIRQLESAVLQSAGAGRYHG